MVEFVSNVCVLNALMLSLKMCNGYKNTL
jgi:hypothetical protein